MAGHELIIEQEVEKYSDKILKRELNEQYSSLGFHGIDLTRIVHTEFTRLSTIRKQVSREMLPLEIDRVPVNTMEYEWHPDESGELHLWYRKTEEFLYKMYEHVKEFDENESKDGRYNPEEHVAFLEIERSLRNGLASSAIAGVHDKTRLNRYVQQFYIEGNTVKMNYIDVGLFPRDMKPEEARSLIADFASDIPNTTLHGNTNNGFMYVLSNADPIDPGYIREAAAAKILVSDSVHQGSSNAVPIIETYPDVYRPSDTSWIQAPPESVYGYQKQDVPTRYESMVGIPTLMIGEWLALKKPDHDEGKMPYSFVERMVQQLIHPEEENLVEPEIFVQQNNSITVRTEHNEETHILDVVIVEDSIEKLEKIIYLAEVIPEERVISFVALQEMQKGIEPVIMEVIDSLPEHVIDDIVFLDKNGEPIEFEPSEDNVSTVIDILEIVIENAPMIEERVQHGEQTIACISVVIEQPALMPIFLGNLSLMTEQIVLREQEKDILSIFSELLELMNTTGDTEPIIMPEDLLDVPIPKSSVITGTEKGIILETYDEIFLLRDQQETDERSVLTAFVPRFSFLIGMVLLMKENVQEDLEGIEGGIEIAKENVETESSWLLLSIIWYMAQIREQGTTPLRQGFGGCSRKKKKKKDALPQSGIIFMLSLAYDPLDYAQGHGEEIEP